MDGGSGEPLLVRRSKAKKRSAPAAPHAQERGFGGAAGGDKFLTVWREYHDLLQEMEVKKRRLQSKNQRKLRLLAEVKFLRRKYMKLNSQHPSYKLKGQAPQIQSHMGIDQASTFADHGAGTRVTSTSKNTNLDLNQDSVMNDEKFDYQDHSKHSNFHQDEVDEDTMVKDVKFSVCNSNTGNSPSRDDKRTISWQDHLVLQA